MRTTSKTPRENQGTGDSLSKVGDLTAAPMPKRQAVIFEVGDEKSVEMCANQATIERTRHGYIDPDGYVIFRIKSELAKYVGESFGLKLDPSKIVVESPPDTVNADLCIRVPELMQDIRAYSTDVVPKIAERCCQLPEIASASRHGLYVNVTMSSVGFSRNVANEVLTMGDRYGEVAIFPGHRVLVDFGSPNIGKALHVGHLGTTLVGQVLANVLELGGYTSLKINHLGDWGTPLGKLKASWDLLKDVPEIKALEAYPARYFSALYERFKTMSEQDPTLADTARAHFADLERGTEVMREFWKFVRDRSVEELEIVYDKFNVRFDGYIGESFYEPHLGNVLDEALKVGAVTRADDGTQAVFGGGDTGSIGRFLLVKSDGATTYLTRDLAALKIRTACCNPDLTLYVVGAEQTQHFEQLFYLARATGEMTEREYVHVPIGLITAKGKKISAREGGSLAMEDLLATVTAAAYQGLDDGYPEELRAKIAQDVAVGALIFHQIQSPPGTGMEFDVQKVLNPKGRSGPYLQYTCVRSKSILRKAGDIEGVPPESAYADLHPSAHAVLREAAFLPLAVEKAVRGRSPHHLANYLDSFAKLTNHFIQNVRVKDRAGDEGNAYRSVVKVSVAVLENGLRALNIPIPEKM